MNKYLTINDVKMTLSAMEKYQKDHPKADVIFDIERMRIEITYPLPQAYFDIKDAKPGKFIKREEI